MYSRIITVVFASVLMTAGNAFTLATASASDDPVKRLKQPPAETRFNNPQVVAPMPGTGALPLIRVFLNDQGPFLFHVNTGTDCILIQEWVADRLALPMVSRIDEGRLCKLEHLRIEDLVFSNMVVGVKRWEGEIDGILGYNLFRECVFTIDFPAGQYRFSLQPLDKPDGIEILKFRYGETMGPYISVKTGDETTPFLVSTGYSGYLQIIPDGEKNYHFKFPPLKGLETAGFSVPPPGRFGRVSDVLNLGRHMILEPVIAIVPGEENMIGCGILRHFTVSFDPFNKTVRIMRDSEVPIIIPSVRELGFRVENRPGGCFIAYVLPWLKEIGVDLRVGDQLVTVESQPAGQVTREEWLLFERNFNYLELRLLRDGEEIITEVPMRIILP